MLARIVLIGAVILLLSGCASYDNGYRDGAYYRPNHSGDGDYYYGRPQQRERGYYDPFYGPSYGPYYPSHYYPYYGPYRPYRSGFGFEYNYGNGGYGGYGGYGAGGYGGYGYPAFGLGYTYFGGDRHRRDYGRDHDRDRDRRQGRDRDHDRNDRNDNRPRPYVSAPAPWNRPSYRMGSPGERVRAQPERRDVIARDTELGVGRDNRMPMARLRSGDGEVAGARRIEPSRQGGNYRRDERSNSPAPRASTGGRSHISQAGQATASRPSTAYRAPVSRFTPVDREPKRYEALEKSRNRSQNETSGLEKER